MKKEEGEESITVYYEPADCHRAGCPVCLISAQEGIMVLVPVSDTNNNDSTTSGSGKDHHTNNRAKYRCTNCGANHLILECMHL